MKVVITGSTGMVGKAVLLECLASHRVESVLIINRHPVNIQHPKLKEIIHRDFSDFSSLSDELAGYDACFYCMGISAFRMSEQDYSRITFDFTKAFAETFISASPDSVFIYVSGTGTDSSESGQVMWARVKGRVENRILTMGFKDAYAFRPGAIYPVKGVQSKTRLYNLIYKLMVPLYPLLKHLTPIIESDQLGQAMINVVLHPQDKKHLENKALIRLAESL
ncbi:NAD-dependent epimerase/dehydratase family protein [Endozoicomonas elysicola]|uniref:Epimerase n=1 Tax=Endozoicomonas elysicola TaxID=305900 RepID=A0A081K7P7_9GAMM|nr:NAD-dependent epimerase/dehydratase family protein [Endozoicomonas elysicola]KEI70173.1 epimerase [Endozoicomonas elysicola]